ncbi:MAG: NAD(P)H-dependent oxidoreductase [Candidatus Kapabacteria bacterium]|nr:NAD(P)H-dependent oxidoreductase [Candidatus Kapabacteria bacterium]MDW7997190.1 NAD(P)H-dependent oxidoreductase [Bacteroidota bacterium]
MIRVVGIVGSLRRESYNRKLLRAAQQLAPQDMYIEEALLVGIPLFNPDEEDPLPPAVRELKERIGCADAIIIATPEYNHSIPGVLKNAIDWLTRPPPDNPFNGKPVAIIGATTGNFGTLRAQLHLRQILVYLNADVLNRPEVLVARVKEKVGADGSINDPVGKELLTQLLQALRQRILERRLLAQAPHAG